MCSCSPRCPRTCPTLSDDLARGIRWVLTSAHYESLSDDCVRKVSQSYSQQSVAIRYIDVYQQAMAFKHYRL